MKIIKEISEWIEDELEGAEDYAEAAVFYKEKHPDLARALYEISLEDDSCLKYRPNIGAYPTISFYSSNLEQLRKKMLLCLPPSYVASISLFQVF